MPERGRPTAYNPEIEAEILQRLAAGESLRTICKAEHLPTDTTVRNWAIEDRAGFSSRYAHARNVGLDALAEETLEIARDDKIDPAGRRVILDTHKWFLSKMAPKRYGDRLELAGDKENPLEVNIAGAAELLSSRVDSLIARSRTPELPEKPD